MNRAERRMWYGPAEVPHPLMRAVDAGGLLPVGRIVQVGDFGLARGGGLTGYLTRLGTFSRYGHCCVVVNADPLLIVEAEGAGARKRQANLDEFVWSRCDLTGDQRTAIALAADRCVGLPYGYVDIVRFVFRFLKVKLRTKLLQAKPYSADHPDSKLICSELVAWCYRVAGHEVAPSKDIAPGDVSPGDLADHITRFGN